MKSPTLIYIAAVNALHTASTPVATQLVAQSQQQQAKARNSLLAIGLFESVQYLAGKACHFEGTRMMREISRSC